jgi:hypothetical protein
MEQSLDAFLQQSRQKFRDTTEHSLIHKKRLIDFKRQFELTCRQRYPGLHIAWLTKHTGPLKILLKTYSGEQLLAMMHEYVAQPCYLTHGLSFESFYRESQTIVTVLADRKYRAQLVAKRKLLTEQIEQPPADTTAFQETPFFKKLPKIFQDSIRQGVL